MGVWPEPSAFITKIRYEKLEPSTYAIRVPSGDQAGLLSFASGVLVKFVGSEPSGCLTPMSQVVSPGGMLNSHTVKAMSPLIDSADAETAKAKLPSTAAR